MRISVWSSDVCSSDLLYHDIGRTGDQIVRLEQAVNRGFRYEVALLVGEAHRQFAGAEIGRVGFQRHFDDLVLDVVTDAVPHAARRRWPILSRLRPAPTITVIPTVRSEERS